VIILKTLKAIFIPLIFAIFLSFLFAPLIKALSRKKIPAFVTIILMFIIIFVFFALAGGVIFAAITSFVNEFPKYQQMLGQMIEETHQNIQYSASRANLALGEVPFFDFSELFSSTGFSLSKILSGTMGTFIDFGINLFLTMIFLMFLVAGTGKLEKRVKKVFSEEDNVKTLATMLSIQTQIQRYFFNKTLISLGTALTGMIFLIIFKVDFIIVTGILLFTLNFIPNIGSIIASAFPVLISLAQYGFNWRVAGVALGMALTQMFFANILEPKVMGEKLNITPIMILISLIFWGWVWGIVGMMIAVPVTSAINIILKHFDEKNIVSAIISDT
ncbi:MAG: AI-2E family transporter, partial [Candidatus Cloacimonadaceae bacterium]|nr:AI-2E family transporter [Candidatus Cloacimonadaceae bacterium]